MPTFPLADWQRFENAGGLTASSNGTSVSSSASANTKGSYTQLIASTAFSAQMILLMFDTPSGNPRDHLIDIAVGAGGSEQIIISNLFVAIGGAAISTGSRYLFPIFIPAGSRIAARIQASTGSSTIRISCLLLGTGMSSGEMLAIVDSYGHNTADSGGTSIDPGGSANTKGAYSQLTASTTRPHRWLCISVGAQVNAAMANATWLFDIAVGAGGSEQVIVPNLVFAANLTWDTVSPQNYGPFPITIPTETRLAIRSQCSITDATDRLLDATLYGIG